MDIEEYLKQKKSLEKKKDFLEAKDKLAKEKKKVKPEYSEKSFETRDDNPHGGGSHRKDHGERRSGGNGHWIFLGIAFLIALIVVGVFSMYYFFPKDIISVADESDSEVGELKQQLEDLQKSLEDMGEEDGSDSGDIDGDVDDEEEDEGDGIGPDFKLYIEDDWDEEVSFGVFDEFGKINGERLNIIGDMYTYTVKIKNGESSRIKCDIDEETTYDEDVDGDVDDEEFKLNWQIIELNQKEEDVFLDSVAGMGLITTVYEARCYFCETDDCNEVYTSGEEVKRATVKVTFETEDDDEE